MTMGWLVTRSKLSADVSVIRLFKKTASKKKTGRVFLKKMDKRRFVLLKDVIVVFGVLSSEVLNQKNMKNKNIKRGSTL